MWRFSRSLARAAAVAAADSPAWPTSSGRAPPAIHLQSYSSLPPQAAGRRGKERDVTAAEARRLMRLVNVEALKGRLGAGQEVIGYEELLRACEEAGAARTRPEAAALAASLDDAGVVLRFHDKVYLHPDKVVELVRRAVPLALASEDDPRREELGRLQKQKDEIDEVAHRQVRRVLWSGLGFLVAHVGLYFRLTFWEFSWDVMEPITFFTTAAGLVVGYAYFLATARDPTYRDLLERLFLSRQRKLMQSRGFPLDRYLELRGCCTDTLPGRSHHSARATLLHQLSDHK